MGQSLRKLVLIALLQVFTEGKHILGAIFLAVFPHFFLVSLAFFSLFCARVSLILARVSGQT